MTNKQHAKKVLEILKEILGGEGWDDPKLLDLLESHWIDTSVSPREDAESLVYNDSFDPRDLV